MRYNKQTSIDHKSIPVQGMGHVIIPSDMDRDSYIEHVKKTGDCMILTDYGGIVKDASIPIDKVNRIEFPSSFKSPNRGDNLGSLISWIKMPRYSKTVIVDIYLKSGEMEFTGEHNIHNTLTDKNGTVISEISSIEGGVPHKTSIVRAEGGEGIAVQDIRTRGANAEASYTQTGDGSINEHADLERNMTALESINISVVEGEDILAFIELLKGKKISMDSEEIIIGSEDLEPAVKGDTLVDIMGNLIDAIRVMVLNTPQGPTISPPLNDAQYAAIKSTLDTIKSKKVSVE